ncbi:MAG: hypothetical protein ACP5PJ_04890, partial [Acidimicrobiales bacterium]
MGRTEEQLESERVDSTLRATTERTQTFGKAYRERFGTDRNRVRAPRATEVDPAQVDALPAERRVHLGRSMWASIEELRDFGRRLSDSFARASLEDLVEDLEHSFVRYETAASRSEIELTATRSTLRRLENRYRAERGHQDAPCVMPRHAPISEA